MVKSTTKTINKTAIFNRIMAEMDGQDDEFLKMPAYEELMQDLVTAVCARLGRIPRTHVFYDDSPGAPTAWTDGNQTYANTGHGLIYGTNWEKHLCACGFQTHECGHVLFTDFVNLNSQKTGWAYGGLVDPRQKLNPTFDYSKLEAKLKDQTFLEDVLAMQNLMEDVYIEYMLKRVFDGVCKAGLIELRKHMYEDMPDMAETMSWIGVSETKAGAFASLQQVEALGFEIKGKD